MVKELKIKKRGGNRLGAGRHREFAELCKNFSVRCPISKIPELKKVIRGIINSYKIKNQKP